VWVRPEFLSSPGLIQVLREAGVFNTPEDQMEEYVTSAVDAGGFALAGQLVEVDHGPGIWLAPENLPGLHLMIPWTFVTSVVTAEAPVSTRAFGLKTGTSTND
jgi:hypothetical protein